MHHNKTGESVPFFIAIRADAAAGKAVGGRPSGRQAAPTPPEQFFKERTRFSATPFPLSTGLAPLHTQLFSFNLNANRERRRYGVAERGGGRGRGGRGRGAQQARHGQPRLAMRRKAESEAEHPRTKAAAKLLSKFPPFFLAIICTRALCDLKCQENKNNNKTNR